MTAITLKTSPQIATPEKWEKNTFSSDDMWSAFQRGEKHQQKKQEQEFTDKFKKNLNKAAVLSEAIFNTAINDYSVDIQKAFLRPDNFENYEVLFIVSSNDYISPKFSDIFIKSHLIKSEFNDKEFHISFRFMPNSKSVNFECIYSDGYMFEYGKKVD
ncbi:MAG: hypothetical protein AAGC65_23510 [Mucilaginibacter sp.]|uniref:hypothetical protein n=1 Tax=Mucilaginibacter sp. TaxID=1882438 RepID=UPI0031A4ADE3